MESFSYLNKFSEIVKNKRAEMKLSQIDFYRYLFPDTNKEDENIKKKMNAIENRKIKNVDIELFITICKKCNISSDYLLGIEPTFMKHESKFIYEYTGLEEHAINKLHDWKICSDNGADISQIGEVHIGDDVEKQIKMEFDKRNGMQYLKILNYLFLEDFISDNKNKKERFSNLSILYSLYSLVFEKPEAIIGKMTAKQQEDFNGFLKNHSIDDSIELDAKKPILMYDESNIFHFVDFKKILDFYTRQQLDNNIERMISYFNENQNKNDCQ